jgi:hypothetical protein
MRWCVADPVAVRPDLRGAYGAAMAPFRASHRASFRRLGANPDEPTQAMKAAGPFVVGVRDASPFAAPQASALLSYDERLSALHFAVILAAADEGASWTTTAMSVASSLTDEISFSPRPGELTASASWMAQARPRFDATGMQVAVSVDAGFRGEGTIRRARGRADVSPSVRR